MSRAAYASVEDMLAAARSGLKRLDPIGACRAVTHGAWMVDIRPREQRIREGEIPGALVIERNHLEWRLHPTSAARLPVAAPGHLLLGGLHLLARRRGAVLPRPGRDRPPRRIQRLAGGRSAHRPGRHPRRTDVTVLRLDRRRTPGTGRDRRTVGARPPPQMRCLSFASYADARQRALRSLANGEYRVGRTSWQSLVCRWSERPP